MGKQFFDSFLLGAMAISAIMVLIWLARAKSKGVSAYMMAGAFAAFGGMSFVLRNEGSQNVAWGLAVLLVLFLFGDFAARSARQAQERDEK
jgi:hypothetical protein